MEYKLPEGTDSKKVLKDLQEIESYLKTREEITHVTTSIGGTPGRYNLVRSIANPSLTYGELIIDFTSPDALEDNMDAIQTYLTAQYPDAYVKLKRYNLMFKKYPIEAQFLGPDPAVLHRLADSARIIMERTPEVCLITTDWNPDVPVLTVEYDQPIARALGLSRNDVSISLLTATGGIPIGTFYDGIHKDNIYLKSVNEQGKPIEDLNNTQIFSQLPSFNGLMDKDFLVKLQSGNLDKNEIVETLIGSTPLKQVCKQIDVRWEPSVVPRYNGQRSQRVQCSPSPGIETESARQAIAEQIEAIHLPEGYSLQWQGEHKASTQSMKYLFLNFPLAIVLMIGILIMLFKDYRKPIIILCCLPFVIVGVVIVMLLTGKVFNFVAIVGTLGLMGMLIKNSIVLMDEITSQISQGVEPITALIDSSQSRLRPVMMASLTTILGMIPLLPDAMFGSLAASIMGGLLFATVITLFFIPVLYALFFKIKTT
jgi:multidrug efflux pump subunit AcrB